MTTDTLAKLADFFHANEAWQLARIDDGRIQLHLADDQYNAIRALVAQQVAPNPLAKRCYTMSESHLSGHRVIIGFEHMEDAQDAHQFIANTTTLRALTAQALPAAEPTRPANSQQWAGMDGATAFQLIERHADGWADIALMMSEWLAANQAAQQAAQATAGWVLVPVEPTAAMLAAVVSSMDEHLLGKEAEKQYRDDWAAMLAARPALPQPQPQSAQAKGDAA